MCNCLCEFCADFESCQLSMWCNKAKKYCIAKEICNLNPDITKLEGCFELLKQQSLFEDQENHNQ